MAGKRWPFRRALPAAPVLPATQTPYHEAVHLVELPIGVPRPEIAPPTTKHGRQLRGQLITSAFSEFNRLCQRRDLAGYRAVAAIQTVLLFWEAQDYDLVLAQLQKVLADFKAADARISQFRNSYQGDAARHENYAT